MADRNQNTAPISSEDKANLAAAPNQSEIDAVLSQQVKDKPKGANVGKSGGKTTVGTDPKKLTKAQQDTLAKVNTPKATAILPKDNVWAKPLSDSTNQIFAELPTAKNEDEAKQHGKELIAIAVKKNLGEVALFTSTSLFCADIAQLAYDNPEHKIFGTVINFHDKPDKVVDAIVAIAKKELLTLEDVPVSVKGEEKSTEFLGKPVTYTDNTIAQYLPTACKVAFLMLKDVAKFGLYGKDTKPRKYSAFVTPIQEVPEWNKTEDWVRCPAVSYKVARPRIQVTMKQPDGSMKAIGEPNSDERLVYLDRKLADRLYARIIHNHLTKLDDNGWIELKSKEELAKEQAERAPATPGANAGNTGQGRRENANVTAVSAAIASKALTDVSKALTDHIKAKGKNGTYEHKLGLEDHAAFNSMYLDYLYRVRGSYTGKMPYALVESLNSVREQLEKMVFVNNNGNLFCIDESGTRIAVHKDDTPPAPGEDKTYTKLVKGKAKTGEAAPKTEETAAKEEEKAA